MARRRYCTTEREGLQKRQTTWIIRFIGPKWGSLNMTWCFYIFVYSFWSVFQYCVHMSCPFLVRSILITTQQKQQHSRLPKPFARYCTVHTKKMNKTADICCTVIIALFLPHSFFHFTSCYASLDLNWIFFIYILSSEKQESSNALMLNISDKLKDWVRFSSTF